MTEHIIITNITPRIQYIADGTTTTYEFPFAIFETSDLKVYFNSTLQNANTYTVSIDTQNSCGSVVFQSAPTQGTVITLNRELSIERTSDFQEGCSLRANVLNDELDYQIACQQQIADELNRSMTLPPYAVGTNVNLTLPTPSAGKAIVWNSDGTNLENSTVAVNALESTLKSYKQTAETASATATQKAADATEQAQIATTKAQEATTTLANKANKDMDNLSTTGKENVMALLVPDYSAGVSITSGYTAPSDGIFFYKCHYAGGTHTIEVNGNTVFSGYSGGGGLYPTITLPVGKGDVITYTISTDQPVQLFFPLKGANNA